MIFRILIGVFINMCYVSSYVYCMEIIGPNYRSSLGIWVQACFAIGYGLLSPISYLFPGWKNLQIIIGCFIIPQFVLVILFVGESPRYLFVKGKINQAKKYLGIISDKNGNVKSSDK